MSGDDTCDAPGESLPEPLSELVSGDSGAFSASTVRALKSDLSIWAAWCARRMQKAFPAAPEPVAGFVEEMSGLRAPATVRRYLTSISIAQRFLDCADVTKSEAVRLALRRMHVRRGRRQEQAHGLTLPLRNRLLAAAGGRLIDDRNRALLALAYDTLLRRAEISALEVGDVHAGMGDDATVLVRRSKTDREGKGEMVWLAPDSLKLVLAWLGRAGIADGPLFRSVSMGGHVGGRLPPGQVSRIFKKMALAADLPGSVVRGISGHSTRVGATQDMIAAGIELPAVQHAGRWKSATMVNRYGERLLASRSGAAQLARKQGRT